MANEVQYSGSLGFNGDGITATLNGSSVVSPSEVEVLVVEQTVGTDDETLTLGDLAAVGRVMVKNTDATNYVEVGPDGSSYPIKVPAGETAGPLLWNAAAFHMKANTAPCKVVVLATGR